MQRDTTEATGTYTRRRRRRRRCPPPSHGRRMGRLGWALAAPPPLQSCRCRPPRCRPTAPPLPPRTAWAEWLRRTLPHASPASRSRAAFAGAMLRAPPGAAPRADSDTHGVAAAAAAQMCRAAAAGVTRAAATVALPAQLTSLRAAATANAAAPRLKISSAHPAGCAKVSTHGGRTVRVACPKNEDSVLRTQYSLRCGRPCCAMASAGLGPCPAPRRLPRRVRAPPRDCILVFWTVLVGLVACAECVVGWLQWYPWMRLVTLRLPCAHGTTGRRRPRSVTAVDKRMQELVAAFFCRPCAK